MSTKKIGLKNAIPRNILAITAEEFLKEISEGDFFFNNAGECGRIRTVTHTESEISFYKDKVLIPNPIRRLNKESEFYRQERGNSTLLICIGDGKKGKEINTFIHLKK